MDVIPFNKPKIFGSELHYIQEAISIGHFSGNGKFTKKCQSFFEKKYGFKKALLTSSCTDALEMAAILSEVKEGDEVIIPSYTFVSTALAFVRQGAKIVFADSYPNHPNIDADKLESLITKRTKVIVPIHYAGMACDMDKIMAIAKKYDLLVVEDAAQAVDSYYTGADGINKPCGSIGHFGTFSFHETKNIISGEGGMLTINDERFIERSEIIWEKGTNRSAFFRGEINKYGWVDTGSSFLPSEITAAFLWGQIENMDKTQTRRVEIWNKYYSLFKEYNILNITLPIIPDYTTNNAHMFYLIAEDVDSRQKLLNILKKNGILSVFHYLSLHKSEFYLKKHNKRNLPNADNFTNKLFRLPLFYDLKDRQIEKIVNVIKSYYER